MYSIVKQIYSTLLVLRWSACIQRPHDGGFLFPKRLYHFLKHDYRKTKNTTRAVGFSILHSWSIKGRCCCGRVIVIAAWLQPANLLVAEAKNQNRKQKRNTIFLTKLNSRKNQIKLNQIKSNQIKSNRIESSNRTESNRIESIQIKFN